jgi:hypothetical protein
MIHFFKDMISISNGLWNVEFSDGSVEGVPLDRIEIYSPCDCPTKTNDPLFVNLGNGTTECVLMDNQILNVLS